jgi:CheY-like chemotaxis protein
MLNTLAPSEFRTMTRSAPDRVLVVDDEPSIRELVADMLAVQGYEVLEASNGEEALALALVWRPDLILLDMRMPVMDGWQFAEQYREQPGRHAPIVVMTAELNVQKCRDEVRAQAYLEKPFRFADLCAVVARHLPASSGAAVS